MLHVHNCIITFILCVTAAGSGPVVPVLTFVLTSDDHWSGYASGRYGDSVRDGYRILFTWGGHLYSPHRKVAGLVLLVLLITWLLGIWLTDKLNTAQNGSGDWLPEYY